MSLNSIYDLKNKTMDNLFRAYLGKHGRRLLILRDLAGITWQIPRGPIHTKNKPAHITKGGLLYED
jgi:hypothetical protein